MWHEPGDTQWPEEQKFFGSFFQKRTASSLEIAFKIASLFPDHLLLIAQMSEQNIAQLIPSTPPQRI